MSGRPGGEDGSASVWVLAAGLLLVTGAAVPVGQAEIAVCRHRAAAAADLGALAGAKDAVAGGHSACALAARVAAANRAVVVRCEAAGCSPGRGRSVQVEVAVATPGFAARIGLPTATAVARAGPAGCGVSVVPAGRPSGRAGAP